MTVAYTADQAPLKDAHTNATAIGTIGETAVMNNSTQDDTAAKVDFGNASTAVASVVIRFRAEVHREFSELYGG